MERRRFFKWTGAALGAILLESSEIPAQSEGSGPLKLTDVLPSPQPGKFPQYLLPGLGFSFSHSGLSNPETMSRLVLLKQENKKTDDGHNARRLGLEDRDRGLRLTVEYLFFPAHHAVVYGGYIENAGLQ